MHDWSIEEELRRAAGADNVETALRVLKILPIDEQLDTIPVISDWARGGAETYIFRFDVRTRSGLTIPVIVKAHTPSIGPRSVEESLSEMVRRRRLLADAGIRTPVLYYTGNGIVIEQYVPVSFCERLSAVEPDSVSCLHLATELMVIAIALDQCGFDPVDVIGDLRADESDHIYMIDFGQDLGPAHTQPNRAQNENRCKVWLRDQAVGWPVDQIKAMALEQMRTRDSR